ncbi:D-alanyl-D-alanine carboxypeptidase/D-alanyl-D-alanine-endopeptidase [Synechococcus sp. BSF8S]|uniref:D-alanyl-D-alanine carboxypeptidase/D-alanyl-D-alanine endopeptidase n=1 Tax=Synechococcales TaxID=1890424 RepID=UPI001625DFAC|nr:MULTISPECIES: D-alanyl-D-alanine carboxypeptidase/D-alanyl-D-alanine-endopeptidase [unclassified Synechococcus]MBC1260443.1 D-alanyl-D-alanine carboxypeptidase/D-alanyl-D-alanine-endopeptidase [Synechococcus sp. BSF8S]MBC1263814.1 D-alanyl-D-alanine carboxypeptidase/D-alanyl-D-alanine-endopeptidase [Synechococcus sp. BSA11S]
MGALPVRAALFALALVPSGSAAPALAEKALAEAAPPAAVAAVMNKPRYAGASWSLLVSDLSSGRTLMALNPDQLAFTGSVRKLFSVGRALQTLGAEHRVETTVLRRGPRQGGRLAGDLVLVSGGDLTFGGRQPADGGVAFTAFDHNDANNLGTALLTPQDPLQALDALARQVRQAGISQVEGDVVVDDRLFPAYRVPNGNLLITPILVNENMVDVSVTPTAVGEPARVDWRPRSAAFQLKSSVRTVAAGEEAVLELSGEGRIDCRWREPCTGTISGTIPLDYRAPLSGSPVAVRTFRIEDPASYARIAFREALARAGVDVQAPLEAPNNRALLERADPGEAEQTVASWRSAPYGELARLILKVSLNLGANLSLTQVGLSEGERRVEGALAAERRDLIRQGLSPQSFRFPTNGSGSPDSQATARAVVQWLGIMQRSPQAAVFRAALPVLGVDGSLAETGRDLAARGKVMAKTGTTIDSSGLRAQVLAGYLRSRSGRDLAFALFVNDAGPVSAITDVAEVFEDQAVITDLIRSWSP